MSNPYSYSSYNPWSQYGQQWPQYSQWPTQAYDWQNYNNQWRQVQASPQWQWPVQTSPDPYSTYPSQQMPIYPAQLPPGYDMYTPTQPPPAAAPEPAYEPRQSQPAPSMEELQQLLNPTPQKKSSKWFTWKKVLGAAVVAIVGWFGGKWALQKLGWISKNEPSSKLGTHGKKDDPEPKWIKEVATNGQVSYRHVDTGEPLNPKDNDKMVKFDDLDEEEEEKAPALPDDPPKDPPEPAPAPAPTPEPAPPPSERANLEGFAQEKTYVASSAERQAKVSEMSFESAKNELKGIEDKIATLHRRDCYEKL